MPVPKKRRTSATRGQRRSHDAVTPLQMMYEKNSKLHIPRRLHKAASLGIARSKRSV